MKAKIIGAFLGLLALTAAGYWAYRHFSPMTSMAPPNAAVRPAVDMSLELKRRGEVMYKRKYYETLIATYERMLAAAPDNPEIKQKLADAHKQLETLK